jgi:hypothetical protein
MINRLFSNFRREIAAVCRSPVNQIVVHESCRTFANGEVTLGAIDTVYSAICLDILGPSRPRFVTFRPSNYKKRCKRWVVKVVQTRRVPGK